MVFRKKFNLLKVIINKTPLVPNTNVIKVHYGAASCRACPGISFTKTYS
jgi:hypothetical protein